MADLLALWCVMFFLFFVTFPYGVLGQVWYLNVSIFAFFLTFFVHLVNYQNFLIFHFGLDNQDRRSRSHGPDLEKPLKLYSLAMENL